MGLTELIESHLDLNAAVAPSEVGHAKFLPCSFFFFSLCFDSYLGFKEF